MKTTIVDETSVGKRIDQFVSLISPELSRASVQKLIKGAHIKVNDEAQRPSYRLRFQDRITIPEAITNTNGLNLKLKILYEDDDCIVIDKPVGVLTHSKGAFNPEATVATFVQSLSDKIDGERSGIVHRLDRATSGVMICAKTPEALSWLQKQFSSRKVKKQYIAIVSGIPYPKHAIIDMPIERNPKKPQTFRVGSNGKSAITEYAVASSSKNTMLILSPTTGRTHQLRVHLAQIGHPIIGDTLYDGAVADRLYLHACKLEITLLNKERVVFESTIPEAFMERLRE